MALDAESKKFLDEVKKGKPRRFAMICKGVKILTVIVYRKGTEEKYKKEAKKAEGSGQFFGGVVSGKGKNIVFELLASEYDRTPGKELLLKQFLAESGISLKPTYALVDKLSTIDAHEGESSLESDLGQDETESVRGSNSSDAQQTSETDEALPATAEEHGGVAEERKVELLKTLAKLKPWIKNAVAAQPDRQAEITKGVAEAKNSIDNMELETGRERILKLGLLLKEIVGKAEQKPADTPSSPDLNAVPAAENREEIDDRLSAWVQARGEAVTQLRSVSKAVADTKDPDATRVLIVLESIVKNLTPRPTTQQSVDELERYLTTDDVITAAEEVPARFGELKLQQPLLNALAALQVTPER